MNRHYDKARYLDIVRYIREKMPDAALSSDIIVGFPGETEQDFEDTMQILEAVRFDMLFSFIYSPRKGTPAAEMEQVDAKATGKRFDRLLALQHDIALQKNQPMVGKVIRVLCDGPSKNNPEIYCGREEGNKIVFFHATSEDTGNFVNVKIDRADAFALWGEIEK
jgi:tRNA-2-methylthio-N6-dimethylallyladenosine synthase